MARSKPAPFVTVPQAAVRLRVGVTRIKVWCAEGRMVGAFKVGRSWLIPRDNCVKPKKLPAGRPVAVKPKKKSLRRGGSGRRRGAAGAAKKASTK